MSKAQLLGYSHAFLVAADGHASEAKEKGYNGEVHGMMCIIALQNAAVGAMRTLGKGHHEVQKYKKVAGDLKNVRDMLVHFDAYTLGDGKLQEKMVPKTTTARPSLLGRLLSKICMPAMPNRELAEESDAFVWVPYWNTDETMLIMNRRKGEDVVTEYEVPIHMALKNVATLVAAAVKSSGEELSPVLLKLTAGTD